jgi:ribonuclease D
MTYHLIDDQATLQEVAPTLVEQSRIALDCEAAGFHRYTDRLCLVQLSTPDETFLFDPLTIDPSETLRPVLENPDIQVVMHGSDFDLRLLHRDLGIRVKGLFDTQAAAALLGATAIGLASLLDEHLNVQLSKKHQRADWAQRPLHSELLEYASDDTRHLLALGEILERRLREAGRRDWASEEFRVLEEIEWTEDQADPVTRIKGARLLDPRQVTALRVALDWRDGIARARDRAPFRVASDSALMTVVLENPKTIDELSAVKGISPRLARTRGSALLAAVLAVADLDEAELEPYPRGNRNGPGRFSPEEESVAEEVRNLRTEKARELGLEKGVVLSNAQIAEIIRAAPRSLEALEKMPGLRRWQAGLLGTEIIHVLRSPTGSASS